MTPGIAIVGMACRYPDARSPGELWETVLARRRAFRRIPAERLRLEDYWSADHSTPDAIYSTEAAVLEGWEFDRVRFRVAGSTYRAADLAHWLALDVASQALEDAGFNDAATLPRDTTGVIVGNTLTGEFSRANALRLRWPYVRRVVAAELARSGMPPTERAQLLTRLEASYKQPFAPVGEETLAGGLSNTIAGRICNHYDLKGGGYTVDGACAASLLAVITACRSLESHDLDVALAGGVDLSLDPFELVGFAKAGALASDEMRVYDARSQGFWPGEGCGFVTLMREEDALAQGRRVYAVVRGWGVSSDGSGGITRPEVEGQMLALMRAYRRAGFGAHTVGYFEGHGTGTVVGDATELQVLARARRESGDAPPAALGSIKANFGHTKAAAGIAGLLKATLALHHQVLPPMPACEQPHAELERSAFALRMLPEGAPWPDGRPLRAGVNAMGFGGINTHVVLEGVGERRPALASRTRALLDSWQDAELFVFGAADPAGLARQIERVARYAARLSRAELGDLAAALAGAVGSTRARAAVVAARPAELERALVTIAGWIAAGVERRIDLAAGAFLGGEGAHRIAYLFSGQASPAHLRGGALARRFAGAREVYRRAALPDSGDTVATAVAQPAIVAASLAGLAALDALGIRAAVAVGHSLGEITALHWAGAMDMDALLEIARVRGRAMMDTPGPASGMLGIGAAAEEVQALLGNTPVVISGLNLPRQTVVSGELDALELIAARARERGWRAVRLPVSHAFHSPLMRPALPALAAQLARTRFAPTARPVCSTVEGRVLDAAADVTELLARQLTSPVRFMDAVRAMGPVDLTIEVGPGAVLTGLAGELLSSPVIASDAGGPTLAGFLAAAGAAFALGADLRHEALFTNRFARPFDLDWNPRFLVNPCELAPEPDGEVVALAGAAHGSAGNGAVPLQAPAVTDGTGEALDVLAIVRRSVAERVELPVEAVRAESRLLDDLHLNSIAVGQLIATIARQIGLEPAASPTDYADATVAEVARALEERLLVGAPPGPRADAVPAGVDAWIRTFTIEHVALPVSGAATRAARANGAQPAAGAWQVLAPLDHPLHQALVRKFEGAPGSGVVVCLAAEPDLESLDLLLEGARAALATRPRARFVVLDRDGGGGGFARSFHLEAPDGATCVVQAPFEQRTAEWVYAEAMAAEGYSEARYDEAGRRTQPVLRPLTLPAEGPAPLDANDVLLVTGGGKGIASECALALALACGCKLALLGRSHPESDLALAMNLDRMRAAGARLLYLAADVTDEATVRGAVLRIESELGPVTSVLHGAGVNAPELIRRLTRESAHRTVETKVRGAEHVLAAIDLARLKLFVAFGSIIARTGLRGEADYALANEWLTRLTERLARRAPRCRALAIEWSVWSGVGMGERLGRVDALASQGVTPISPDQGIAIFLRLVGASLPAGSVVVSGRFGALPTLEVEPAELPLLRFLERPRAHFPGIELVVESDLDPITDPYLEDHVFGGVTLFPAVMGLEAMAQVATALAGVPGPPAFENVRFDRPVAVPAGGTTIRVAALVRKPGVVDVALRCKETGYEVDHFRATCVTAEDASGLESRPAANGARTAHASNGKSNGGPGAPIPLAPGDLYGGILFHRGRFQRLCGYRRLRATECVADISSDGGAAWFGRYLPATLILGDPAARDSAIHAIQACIPHATILPIGVARVRIERMPANEPRTVEAHEVARDGAVLVYDVEVRDMAGVPRERWEGLRLRIVGDAARGGPWPAALLGPYVERRIAELIPGTAPAVAVLETRADERRARSDAAIAAALGRHATVRRRPDGKPEVDGGHVSAAHSGLLTLAVAGHAPVGCDLERIEPRAPGAWRELLGAERASLAERIAAEARESLDVAATRVWSAMECVKKAGEPLAPLRAGASARDGWVVVEAGRLSVATLATTARGVEGEVVLAVLSSPEPHACAPMNTGTWSASKRPTSSATSTT